MNREFLEKQGLEKEVIDEIMKEHGKAIQAVKPGKISNKLKLQKKRWNNKYLI